MSANYILTTLVLTLLASSTFQQNISPTFDKISDTTFNFILRESGVDRFEVPKSPPFPYHSTSTKAVDPLYSYDYTAVPFSLTIRRKSTNEIIFSSNESQIIFKENYTELTTTLPSKYIFGLGERTTSFLLQPGQYTIYNRDAYGVVDDGKGGGNNRYGHHPVYLVREQSGNYIIVYLRNSLPMDVIISNTNGNYTLTYKIVGGVLDFSVFFSETKSAESAVRLYHGFLGGHTMPPFWSMGFHQCRWGYHNLDMIHDVLEKYKLNNLPFDTIWMDIDYMQDYVPFSVDETRYNLTLFKTYLHDYRKKFVMIAEPAMSIKWPDYKYLIQGKELDLFIKNKEGENLINRVWPGDCYFIDYFHPNTSQYWHDALTDLHEKLDFSGLWLDMNEVATFEPGQVDITDKRISCNDDTVYPYLPANQPLERNTICPNAKHFNNFTHVQVHNYNPVAQQMLTHKFLEEKFSDSFPFILSRANSAGSGKWSFHWTGDNVSSQTFYKMSISEVMNSNLFGMPMVGADICGFAGDAEEKLCSRFYQMGTLFPFSRSHSANDTNSKEPYAMGNVLLNTVKKSLTFRYQILKYYYSLFIKGGNVGTIFRPLFFNLNDDLELLDNLDVVNYQFMIGEDLLVIPNFNEDNSDMVKGYFPDADWFDLRYNTFINKTGPGYVNFTAPLEEMSPVFLKGGRTIFTNDVDLVENTYDLNSNFNFLIAFDNGNGNKTRNDNLFFESAGQIPALLQYHSKRKVNECMQNDCMINVNSNYDVENNTLNINFRKAEYYSQDFSYMSITSFRIYGVNLEKMRVADTNLDDLIEDLTERKENLNLFSKIEKMIFGNGGSNKYSLEQVNANYFVIHINGSLKIKNNQDLNLFIKFK